MASFSLRWRKSTRKDLRRISRDMVSRIIAEVEKLADEPLPHGSEKLTGSEHT
jgi:mRNA-degrading endonuclease RelE of RelBE toxin-antitoxin system